MYYFDLPITWGIIIVSAVISIIADLMVRTSYNKYKNIDTENHKSGFDVAREILDANGLNDIHVVSVNGILTDHYDPKRKVVRLSTDVFDGTSIASVAVAAHEVGHAIQDKVGYSFMKIRSLILPMVNIGSKLGYFVIE